MPNIGFSDGIEAARTVFSKCWFDEKKTTELVKALRTYRKGWDEKLGRFKDHPLKDWACDPADAFRMMAVGHRDIQKLGEYDKEEEELILIKENEERQQNIDPFDPFNL